MLGHAWARLVADGLLRDILAAAVGGAITPALAWRPWRAHQKRQDRIIDLLDTSTPGGLADLVPKPTGRRVPGQPEGKA